MEITSTTLVILVLNIVPWIGASGALIWRIKTIEKVIDRTINNGLNAKVDRIDKTLDRMSGVCEERGKMLERHDQIISKPR